MVSSMKTTVELPDELLREAQRIVRDEGTTLKSLLEEGLRAAIARHRSGSEFVLRDASVSGRGLQPGAQNASWADIREIIYGDRL
jgi:putative antitoxin of VapBC-like toxin-antitoxin system